MRAPLQQELSLNGPWQFRLGAEGDWAEITVPGCWEAQGYPMDVDGPARFRRGVYIPAEWKGQLIRLEMGAVSYHCAAWCNGQSAGEHAGMWAPFALDLTALARPGEDNLIELEIYKPGARYPMRQSLAGFLPDLATTFGGPWQGARLTAGPAALDAVEIDADPDCGCITARCRAAGPGENQPGDTWRVTVTYQGEAAAAQSFPAGAPLDACIPIPGANWWALERPALYEVRVDLLAGEGVLASVSRSVGFRHLSASGSQLLLNGQPFMARGILSWGWDPRRIAPYFTPEQAHDEIRAVKAMGFNLIKLCLFVPNREYFEAADEEGMLLWQELPMWLPEVNARWRAQTPKEYEELARLVRGHPSVILWSLGCELSQSVDARMLEALNRAVRPCTLGALVCDNSGSGESYGGLEVDFADFTDYHPYYDLHYFEPLLDHWRRDWQPTRPWIFGEFCDSDTFRDQREIEAAEGRRPWWLTRANPVAAWRSEAQAAADWHERLAQSAPGFDPAEIKTVSYRQAYLIRKHTLEALRRRAGMGGYIITGLRDTPISTSGVWDDLGNAKWSAEEYAQINADDVLSLDVGRRRTWRSGGDRPAPIDPHALYAGQPMRWYVILHCARRDFLAGAEVRWLLVNVHGTAVRQGKSTLEQSIKAGQPAQAAVIALDAPAPREAEAFELRVWLTDGERRVENRWPVWVYPRAKGPENAAVYDPPGLLGEFYESLKPLPRLARMEESGERALCVTTAWDESVAGWVERGGRALLIQCGDGPLPARRLPFWREAVKLFAPHPTWRRFPHQGFTDLQFFSLASDLAFDTPRLTGALPGGAIYRSILRRVDAREFHVSDYLFEAAIGQGKLLGCALRLQGPGAGAQAASGPRNIAGEALLSALLRALTEDL